MDKLKRHGQQQLLAVWNEKFRNTFYCRLFKQKQLLREKCAKKGIMLAIGVFCARHLRGVQENKR